MQIKQVDGKIWLFKRQYCYAELITPCMFKFIDFSYITKACFLVNVWIKVTNKIEHKMKDENFI